MESDAQVLKNFAARLRELADIHDYNTDDVVAAFRIGRLNRSLPYDVNRVIQRRGELAAAHDVVRAYQEHQP